MAFRAELDGSDVEVLGSNFRNPYELALDSYGRIWQSDNDDDGNQGVRINYLMEYGNYGYKDQITGASWQERRVGWNDSIPLRHWHLNDPGVVPNLLQTGSGSPTGMIVYEGNLLPELYKNQLIHTEPGHNVVRSYIVENDGAGYKARIENIVTSKDDWFRPDDVTAAPDGSLFISDWYDGGVGGHRAADVARGRIYHLSTKTEYLPIGHDFTTGEGATQGLFSDNMDVFYQSWQKLHSMGEAAVPFLEKLIEQGGIAKARALWLGAKIPSKADHFIGLAIRDKEDKFRSQAIRMAKYVQPEKITDYIALVVKDPSIQVRREAVVALKFVGTPKAAALWAQLAIQHKAGDRWELEALGIGADKFPDLYFEAWKTQIGDDWNNLAGSEIVWRVRASSSVPLLVDLIKNTSVSKDKLPSYFRAFHFKNHPEKNKMLLTLLEIDHPEKEQIQALAIGQMDAEFVNSSAKNIQAVKKVLPSIEGSSEWLLALKKLKIKGMDKPLFDMIISDTDLELKKEAASILFDSGGDHLLISYLKSNVLDSKKVQVMQALGGLDNNNAIDFLESSLNDNNLSAAVKTKAVESLGNTWGGQHRLYDLLKADKLEGLYKTAAALKLMTSWDPKLREDAPKFLNTSNKESTDITSLIDKEGDSKAGKNIYTTYCATCHIAEGNGTDFGPALSDIGNKLSKSAMLSAIVYPSAGINFGYEGYQIQLNDGGVLMGYILSRTEDVLTLKMMGGTIKEISINEIETIEEMEKSLMPEGLDKVMSQDDLINLISYMGTLKVK